jgi:hypothetical protein
VTDDYILGFNTRNLTAPAHLFLPGQHYSECGKVFRQDSRIKFARYLPEKGGPHGLCEKCFSTRPTLRERIVRRIA